MEWMSLLCPGKALDKNELLLLSTLLSVLVLQIKKKVYIGEPENDGVPDHQAAHEAWMRHLKRNRSIVINLFQVRREGDLHSHLWNEISRIVVIIYKGVLMTLIFGTCELLFCVHTQTVKAIQCTDDRACTVMSWGCTGTTAPSGASLLCT